MKSYPSFSKPISKPINLEVLCSRTSNKEIKLIKKALTTTYEDALNVIIEGQLELLEEAYNSKRDQYNADILLSYLLKTKKTDTALWVIQKDLYCKGMNLIFGYEMYHRGAVISTNRLSTQELIEKEAIHEVGHILGLQHFSNHCVMQFSNSLWEAKMKPSYLCESCKRKITSL